MIARNLKDVIRSVASAIAVVVLSCAAAASAARAPATVAVLELRGENVPPEQVRRLSDRLRFELFRIGTFDVVQRERTEAALQEHAGRSGCATTACAVEVGRALGASRVVVGTVRHAGDTYALSLRLVEVSTGKTVRLVEKRYSCTFRVLLTGVLRKAARELGGAGTETASDPFAAFEASEGGGAPRASLGKYGRQTPGGFGIPVGFRIGVSGSLPGRKLADITDGGGALTVRFVPYDEEGVLREGAQFDVFLWSGALTEIAIVGQYEMRYHFPIRALAFVPFVDLGAGLARRYSFTALSRQHDFSARDFSLLDYAYQFGGGFQMGRYDLVVLRQVVADWAWLEIGLSVSL